MRTPVSVATIGVFDGFHRGHAEVVERARARAVRAAARLMVITFDRHPRAVVAPETVPAELASRPTTLRFLREAGANEIRVIRFTPATAAKSPPRFLRDHVFPYSRLAALVVGHDFAMGRDRGGDSQALERLGAGLGFAVEAVEAVREGGEAISSSRIRTLIAGGDMEEAERCLGRPYRMSGRVETGDGRGRTLGFPTANVAVDPGRMRPALGVYAVRVSGEGIGSPGVANVGIRPTFGGGEVKVEVHLLGETGNLVGKTVAVEFASRLRPERKFNNTNELTSQIEKDVQRARTVLGVGDRTPEST